MARISGKNAKVYWGTSDVSGDSNRFTLNVEIPSTEMTAFGDTSRVVVDGVPGWNVEVEAWYNRSSTLLEALLTARQGSGTFAMTVAPAGTTGTGGGTGVSWWSGNVVLGDYSIESPHDAGVAVRARFNGTGALTRAGTL